MGLYPHVQRRAQEEIDRILGPNKIPSYIDRENLPYIDALVKETLRWHPVAPMGIPHLCTQDDIYEGYRIPEGSLIMPNIWYSFFLFQKKKKKKPPPPLIHIGPSPTIQRSTLTQRPSNPNAFSQQKITCRSQTPTRSPSDSGVEPVLANYLPIIPSFLVSRSRWLSLTSVRRVPRNRSSCLVWSVIRRRML